MIPRSPGPLIPALCVVCAALPPGLRAAQAQAQLATHETKYYTLRTDLDDAGVREATLRVTLMAEEYMARTRGLAGTVRQRLPFYLFSRQEDYLAAGGLPGTAGVFTGSALAGLVVRDNPQATWHTVQHEGFHQFVHATIGPDLPLWANEGMAEYFGEGLWTGDHFIVGLVPPARLARIRAGIDNGKFMTLRAMMLTQPEIWTAHLSRDNYDQAWSMVHFLAHADGDRYQQPFMGFLRDVSRKVEWQRAWRNNLGDDVGAFELRWKEFWTSLPEDPTADLYAQAVASTLTSFYARALSQQQKFETPADLLAAARAGQLKSNPADWLPTSLLEAALKRADAVGTWTFKGKGAWRPLVLTTPRGTAIEGTFKIVGGRVKDVTMTPRPARK